MTCDATGRRLTKTVTMDNDWDGVFDYFYNGWQQIETRNGSNWVVQQQVFGLQYIDELLEADVNTAPTTSTTTCNTKQYVLQDANYNVTMLLDTSGEVIERYSYTPYGQRTAFKRIDSSDHFGLLELGYSQYATDGTAVYSWTRGTFGHQGLYQDEEVGLIDNRARAYNPILGRYMQADPIGKEVVENARLFLNKIINLSGSNRNGVGFAQDPIFESAMQTAIQKIAQRQGPQNSLSPVIWQYATGLNLYQFIDDNPLDGVDPTGEILPTSRGIYGIHIPGASCHGSCKCTFPPSSLVTQVGEFFAFAGALQPCALASCTVCTITVSPGNQPVAMTACMQQALRLLFGPGVTCGCT